MSLYLDDEVYVYQVDDKGSMKNYELHEVYKISRKGPPISNIIGSWSMSNNCFSFVNTEKNVRRQNLRVSRLLSLCLTLSNLFQSTFLSRESHSL